MKDDGFKPKIVKIDGGMTQNNWFNQFLSDVSNLKILKSYNKETTALGAALIAGYGIRIFKSMYQISKKIRISKQYKPKMAKKNRFNLLNGWSQAIRKTII